jgi:AcrR family transcriptional regulator
MATANPRRTQEQRRTEMRARLLEATIESLMEDGYAATTLRAVASRADVSSGAMTHHFPRRVELVTAAVENLVEQREAVLRPLLDQLTGDHQQRVRAMLDLVWADFSGPLFTVFVKLWVAAHDDAELYERMIPLERKLARIIASASAQLAAATEFHRDDLDARALTVLAAARGLALQRAFEPRRRRGADPWPRLRPILERMLLEP